MPYCENGDLFGLIEQKDGLVENTARYFSHQIADAVSYMHDENVVHRDIKLENVVINKEFKAQFIDFGFAVKHDRVDKVEPSEVTKYGTITYFPPELLGLENLVKQKPDLTVSYKKCDMFSLGVLIFQLFIGRLPFMKASATDDHYKFIMNGDWATFWKIHPGKDALNALSNPSEFKKMIKKLLTPVPEDRLSPQELLAHRFMSQNVEEEDA